MMALHVACLYGAQSCLEVVVDLMSSSQVKSVDDFGRSALHAAAICGYVFFCVFTFSHLSTGALVP